MDLKKFLPEEYREDTENVINRVVNLLERFLEGEIDERWDFEEELNNIYGYWDLVRTEQVDKARKIIDSQGIADIIADEDDDETIARILYALPHIYTSKGTYRMFRYVLSLTGMDADIIPWYDDRYLNYRAERDKCSTILKIDIKNKPVIDIEHDKLIKLVNLILDVCLVIESVIYVKTFIEQVEFQDNEIKTELEHLKDNYSKCKLEIDSLYNYDEYNIYGEIKRKEEVRYLTPTELTRYKCGSCGYIYDPLENERTPFSELSNDWVCPECSKTKVVFKIAEINPLHANNTLKFAIAYILHKQEFDYEVNLWNNTETGNLNDEYLKHYLESIGNLSDLKDNGFELSNSSTEYLENLLVFLNYLEKDNFRLLETIGLDINPSSISKYRRGTRLSPYLTYGDPANFILDIVDHNPSGYCPHIHNGIINHSSVSSRYYPQNQSYTYNRHVRDPVLYYRNEIEISHNAHYKRGERFDYDYIPDKTCKGITYWSENGVYAYPRRLGEKWFQNELLYGFINGKKDEKLEAAVKYLRTQKSEEAIELLRDIINSLSNYNIFSFLNNKLLLLFDEKYKENLIDKGFNLKFASNFVSSLSSTLWNLRKEQVYSYRFSEATTILNSLYNTINSFESDSIFFEPLPTKLCQIEKFGSVQSDLLEDEHKRIGVYHDSEINHNGNFDYPLSLSWRDKQNNEQTSFAEDEIETEEEYIENESNLILEEESLYNRNGKFLHDYSRNHNINSISSANIEIFTNKSSLKIGDEQISSIFDYDTRPLCILNLDYSQSVTYSGHSIVDYNLESNISNYHNSEFYHNESRNYITTYRASHLGRPIVRTKPGTYEYAKLFNNLFYEENVNTTDTQSSSHSTNMVESSKLSNRSGRFLYNSVWNHNKTKIDSANTEVYNNSNSLLLNDRYENFDWSEALFHNRKIQSRDSTYSYVRYNSYDEFIPLIIEHEQDHNDTTRQFLYYDGTLRFNPRDKDVPDELLLGGL